MLIGGFYSLDAELLCQETEAKNFSLRLDKKNQYPYKRYTNNGRTASIYALKQASERIKGKKILLPDYLCVSVLAAIEEVGFHYEFYKVNQNLEVDIVDLRSKITEEIGMIYVIHYFAVPQPKRVVDGILELAEDRRLLVLEDITQALFSVDADRMGFGDFIIGSTRKWFPMTDGGIVAVKEGIVPMEIPLQNPYNEAVYKELLISVARNHYDANPQLDRAGYLKFEKEANASRYTDLEIREMTEASRRIFLNSDKEELIKRRCENYEYLCGALRGNQKWRPFSGPLPSQNTYVPFGFVILAENREDLYDYLVKNHIVPEIQWILPYEYYEPGASAKYLSEHNLMLQCDQRYGLAEMKTVVDVLNSY